MLYPVKNTSCIKSSGLSQGGIGGGTVTTAVPANVQLVSVTVPTRLQFNVVVVVVVLLVEVVDVLDVVVVVGTGPGTPTITSKSSQHPFMPE